MLMNKVTAVFELLPDLEQSETQSSTILLFNIYLFHFYENLRTAEHVTPAVSTNPTHCIMSQMDTQ